MIHKTMTCNNHFIHFTEQCKYCTRGLNTTYCDRNQRAIEMLKEVNKICLGSIDFKCDYFVFDEKVYNELNPGSTPG